MNLYEKLNRLDDSLVESKRVVKKKKLTESVDDKPIFHALEAKVEKLADELGLDLYVSEPETDGDTVELWCTELFDIEGTGLIDVIELSEDNKQYLFDVDSVKDYLDTVFENYSDKEYDDIDEKLTESSEKTTIEVMFEPYTRYGYEPIKTGRVSGKDLLDALLKMTDKMRLYIDSDYAAAYEEDNGVKLTAEDILKRIETENGDGCDFIFYIKNLTTGEMIFDSGYEEAENWDDDIDDDIDEMLTENRWNPYFTPYGYKDAAKVLNGKAPEYYYHLKHIEMDTGDGIKLARYALRKGLPVMVNKNSDPDYPEFAIKGKYHWEDYFYSYPTSHEEYLVAWDGKMFVEEQLTEDSNSVSSQLPEDIDAFLQDLAQMYGMFDYKDIMKHEYTEEEIKQLINYKHRFNSEIEYQGDEEADDIMRDIAETVANLIKH